MSPQQQAVCHPEFLEDLQHWIETDRRTARRLLELMKAVLHDPFSGIGKPEPLKLLGAGIQSRRITQEHRCVYLVKADRVELLQGRYHYQPMGSQYALIAEPQPELLEVVVRIQWIYNNDSQLQRPWGEPSPSQLIHPIDVRQLVGPQPLSRFKLLKNLGNEAVHRAHPIPPRCAVLAAAAAVLVSPGGLQPRAKGVAPKGHCDFMPGKSAL